MSISMLRHAARGGYIGSIPVPKQGVTQFAVSGFFTHVKMSHGKPSGNTSEIVN